MEQPRTSWPAAVLLGALIAIAGCAPRPASPTAEHARRASDEPDTIIAYLQHDAGAVAHPPSGTLVYFTSGRVVAFERGARHVREARLSAAQLARLSAGLDAARLASFRDAAYLPPDARNTQLAIRRAGKLRRWIWTEMDYDLPFAADEGARFKQAWQAARDLLSSSKPPVFHPVADPDRVYDEMLKLLHAE